MTVHSHAVKARKAKSGASDPVALLEARALAVFGDARAAAEFMATPHARLGGKSPNEVANSARGAAKVSALLDAIAHGLPA